MGFLVGIVIRNRYLRRRGLEAVCQSDWVMQMAEPQALTEAGGVDLSQLKRPKRVEYIALDALLPQGAVSRAGAYESGVSGGFDAHEPDVRGPLPCNGHSSCQSGALMVFGATTATRPLQVLPALPLPSPCVQVAAAAPPVLTPAEACAEQYPEHTRGASVVLMPEAPSVSSMGAEAATEGTTWEGQDEVYRL